MPTTDGFRVLYLNDSGPLQAIYSARYQNDTVLAEAQLKHLITLDIPNKSAPYYYLGQLAEEGKRSDEALTYYRQVGTGEHYLPAQIRSANLLRKLLLRSF